MATLAHLWTGTPPPDDYIDFWLCTQVYHCLPSELDEQDHEMIMKHLTMLGAENQVRRQREINKNA
jgi:hypothetical protein